MKIDVEKLKEPKVIGIIAIVIGLLLVGGLIVMYLTGDDEKPQTTTQKRIDDAERQAIIAELDNTDVEDIDPEKAKKIMGLKVIMPDELKEEYLGDKFDRFKNEAEDFLVECDFYLDVTKINCTQIIMVNYKKNITYMEFEMDDSARSVLTVEYHGNQDKFVFNFR